MLIGILIARHALPSSYRAQNWDLQNWPISQYSTEQRMNMPVTRIIYLSYNQPKSDWQNKP